MSPVSHEAEVTLRGVVFINCGSGCAEMQLLSYSLGTKPPAFSLRASRMEKLIVFSA